MDNLNSYSKLAQQICNDSGYGKLRQLGTRKESTSGYVEGSAKTEEHSGGANDGAEVSGSESKNSRVG